MAKRQDGANRGQEGADQALVGNRIETVQYRVEKRSKMIFQRLGPPPEPPSARRSDQG
jgi:hypothetical protein